MEPQSIKGKKKKVELRIIRTYMTKKKKEEQKKNVKSEGYR